MTRCVIKNFRVSDEAANKCVMMTSQWRNLTTYR